MTYTSRYVIAWDNDWLQNKERPGAMAAKGASIEERVLLRVQGLLRWRDPPCLPPSLFSCISRCTSRGSRGGLPPLLLQQLRQRSHLEW